MNQRTQDRTARQTGAAPVGGAAVVDIWTFTTEPALAAADLAGYSVEARDGKIGKVDEHTNETGDSFLIVDTGIWIFGKKVMLPAGVVERIDPDSETVFVGLTKDEIKSAPEYHTDGGREDQEYRRGLADYYRRFAQ